MLAIPVLTDQKKKKILESKHNMKLLTFVLW